MVWRRSVVVAGIASACISWAMACTGDEPDLSGNESEKIGPDSSGSDTGSTDASLEDAPNDGCPRIVALAAGQASACAARSDGTVLCWGNNDLGQLGVPPGPNRATPELVPELASVKGICAGLTFACAVQQDGVVRCWGNAADGRIGQDPASVPSCGENRCSSVPLALGGLPPAEQIACGLEGACARTIAGDVYCWGSNAGAAAGLDPKTTQWTATPTKIAIGEGATDLSMGMVGGNRVHACVVTTAGDARCWGHNVHYALGVTNDGLPACPGDGFCTPTPVIVRTPEGAVLGGVTSVRAGADHTCALREDGTVWCWGANYAGSLGRGGDAGLDAVPHLPGPTAPFGKKIVAIDAHNETLLAIDETKHVWAWGNANYGAIGDGVQTRPACYYPSKPCQAKPARLAVPTGVERVATGVQFNLVYTNRDELWSWGVNRGELGHPPGEQGDQNCEGYACNPNPTKVALP